MMNKYEYLNEILHYFKHDSFCGFMETYVFNGDYSCHDDLDPTTTILNCVQCFKLFDKWCETEVG